MVKPWLRRDREFEYSDVNFQIVHICTGECFRVQFGMELIYWIVGYLERVKVE